MRIRGVKFPARRFQPIGPVNGPHRVYQLTLRADCGYSVGAMHLPLIDLAAIVLALLVALVATDVPNESA